MYKNLDDFLEINGLQSITVLFSVVSKYKNGLWQPVKSSTGVQLLQTLQNSKYAQISEANSTRWRSKNDLLLDTYYAAQFSNLQFKDYLSLKQILALTTQISKQYIESQIYINDFYPLSPGNGGFEAYIQYLNQVH